MDMAPVSLSLNCLGPTGDETTLSADLKARKRVSVHLPQDVATPRRLSMTFASARCRSLSESWALTSPVSTTSSGFKPLSLSSTSSSSLMTPPPSLPSSPLSSLYQSTPLSSMPNDTTSSSMDGISQVQEQDQDQDLLKSLASFLQNHNSQTQVNSLPGVASTRLASTSSAGPTDTNNACSDLVIRVRDFAYPKTHPYHLGHFPPPAYEESDVEEDDDEPMGWYSDSREEEETTSFQEDEALDRTYGQARGLYDFDAEADTELSFREGEYLWIHSRQFPGWFLGEIAGVTGLVPENYVQIL
ncbi:hypothetical protein CPB97_007057 [Podila verticillata]|nr:hypothetical protein CPB97_007057 [Podila verticillata]